MGMRLVGLVQAKWAPYVPDRAYRVLSRMAFSALDDARGDTPACMYTGGREPLFAVMQDAEKRKGKDLDKAIQRSIKELIKLGAIERLNKPGPGRRAIYRLTLENPIRIDSRHTPTEEWGSPSDPHWGSPTDPQNPIMGVSERPQWGSPTDPPRRTKDLKPKQIQRPNPSAAHPSPSAHAKQPTKKTTEKKCTNNDCQIGYRHNPEKPKGQRNTRCQECNPHPTTHTQQKSTNINMSATRHNPQQPPTNN